MEAVERKGVKVSVVVVTYNQEDYIARAIDSVLSQKCDFPIEIIIGDDCSTDGTGEICLDYARRFPDIIKYRRNERNLGLQGNYFGCMLAASGEYIADCGGDDFWIDPYKLSKQVALLDADSDIVLVHTSWNYYRESDHTVTRYIHDDRFASLYRPKTDGKAAFEALVSRSPKLYIHSCTMMIRRSSFLAAYAEESEMMLDKEFGMEDIPLFIAMSRQGSFGYIDDVTLDYSVGKTSLSSGMSIKIGRFYFGTLKLQVYLRDRFGLDDKPFEESCRELGNFLLGVAFFYCDKKFFREVRSYMQSGGIAVSLSSRVKGIVINIPLINRIAGRCLLKKYGYEKQ